MASILRRSGPILRFLKPSIPGKSVIGAAFTTNAVTTMIQDQRSLSSIRSYSSTTFTNKKCKENDDDHVSVEDHPEEHGLVVSVEDHALHRTSTAIQNTFSERRHEYAGLFQISSLEGNHNEETTSYTDNISPPLFQSNKSAFDQETSVLAPLNSLLANFVAKEKFEKGDGRRLIQKMEELFLNDDIILTNKCQNESESPPFCEKNHKILSEALETPAGKQYKADFLLMLRHGKLPERIITWPLGYAGDYLTIDWIYNNKPQDGQSDFAMVMDEFILESAGAQAVRDRRNMMQDLIMKEVMILESNENSTRDNSIQITSMACGPGREVYDLFIANKHIPIPVCFHLVDLDASALDYIHDWSTSLGLSKTQINLHQNNLLLATIGRETIQLPAQDIIYSLGLIDYLDDKTVICLMNLAYKHLKEGGRLVLGQFHTNNPCRFVMDVLDWKLIHRNEDDMNRLFSQSKFCEPCCDFHYSSNGVQMLAFGIKKEKKS